MLKRNIGDNVNINPYSDITGIIVDSREITQPFNANWGYLIKFNCRVNMGSGVQEQEYYNDESDMLENNWNMVKGIK